jgi:predicted DsbA family dithiol-disulfide isomerase
MARAAYNLALHSDKITADVWEAQEFPDLARQYQVRAVPKTVINDKEELLGSVPIGQLLAAVEKAVAKAD